MIRNLGRVASRLLSVALSETSASACVPPYYWDECDYVVPLSDCEAQGYWTYFSCRYGCYGQQLCTEVGCCIP